MILPSPNLTLETNADFASLRRHRSAFRWAIPRHAVSGDNFRLWRV
jgi:hypothetical protein